jgi:hypothetical protein
MTAIWELQWVGAIVESWGAGIIGDELCCCQQSPEKETQIYKLYACSCIPRRMATGATRVRMDTDPVVVPSIQSAAQRPAYPLPLCSGSIEAVYFSGEAQAVLDFSAVQRDRGHIARVFDLGDQPKPQCHLFPRRATVPGPDCCANKRGWQPRSPSFASNPPGT